MYERISPSECSKCRDLLGRSGARGLGRIVCWPGSRASNSKATRPRSDAARNRGPIGEGIVVYNSVSMDSILGRVITIARFEQAPGPRLENPEPPSKRRNMEG